MSHYAVPVKPPFATPVPAATLVLLRERREGPGVDVLLIRRHGESKFAAGDYVFPGGKVEPDDVPADAVQWCAGLDAAGAARRLGLGAAPSTALGYWIGAIRETFEEVGVLLAYGQGGAPAQPEGMRFADWRRECQQDHQAFWRMVRRERLRLATDRLVYFAHWITPEVQPHRYDTRFFAAPMPSGQDAIPDAREITDLRWLAPGEALEANVRGDISLRFPTITNLGLLAAASSVPEVLAGLAARQVTTIMPKVIVEDGTRRVVLPGQPGYDS